jgi:endonuclease/exonuclease/phosphatase family metal-dependent hydrolase
VRHLADPLGLSHHVFSGVAAQEDQDALSGVAVMSRWPIRRESSLFCGAARVQFAELSGPRGPIQVYGLVMDAWWFDESQARQDAVRELLTHVGQAQDKRAPLIICGDFNTDPDSDEIRMMTGRTTAPVPGLSFYDAWEVAGSPAPGHTWSNDNPHATQLLWPDRRIDYIFPPIRVRAVPAIRGTPPCSAPAPPAAPIPRTTTPFNPTSATEGTVSVARGAGQALAGLVRALAGPGQEGGQPGGDRAGGRGLPPQRRDQGGVGGVAHVGALDEHLGHGGQVDAGQVVAGLDTVGSVVAAERLPVPLANADRRSAPRLTEGPMMASLRPSATGSRMANPRPPGGPPSAWMEMAALAWTCCRSRRAR